MTITLFETIVHRLIVFEYDKSAEDGKARVA